MDSGRPLASAMARSKANSPSRSTKSATTWSTPRPVAPDRARDADQLVGGRRQARRRSPVCRPVRHGPRGREAEGARLDGLRGQPPHLPDLPGRGPRFVVRSPVAHHVPSQRRVGDLRRDVDRVRRRLQGVEVLGEGLPLPPDALVQRGAGDVLHALHERDQPLPLVRPDRGKAHAAVAHHHGRDTLPRRRRDQRVPGGLPVVVRVDVDPAGRHQEPVGVELVPAGCRQRADLGDAPVVDGHVGAAQGGPRAVGHGPAPDHDLVARHAGPPIMMAPRVASSALSLDPGPHRRQGARPTAPSPRGNRRARAHRFCG